MTVGRFFFLQMEEAMSNTHYTDKTLADDPPGGRVHKVARKNAEADRLPTGEHADDGGAKTRGGKTATTPKTVANTEK